MACSKWKMRIKKFLLIVPVLLGFLFVSDTSAFAEVSRVDLGKDLLKGVSGNMCGRTVTKMTDGNSSTGETLFKTCKEIEFKLPKVSNISGFLFIKTGKWSSDKLSIDFRKVDGQVKTITYDKASVNSDKYIKVSVKDVSYVTLRNFDDVGAIEIMSFELYEGNGDEFFYEEIKELQPTITYDSVTFSYKNPKIDFGYLRIYRDGKLIADNFKLEQFKDKELSPNTEYKYKFVAVSSDGIESKGIEKVIKTDEKPNLSKPVKPSNPTITPKDGSLIVNLTNYDAGVKVKGYHIFVDGKQVNDSLVTARSYAITGLKNGQSYQVQIKAVSAWNVESDLSNSVPGIPQVQVIPDIAFNFGLTDLIESIKNWFGGIWPIVAFSIAIPLAFIVAFNTKKLFLR
ncbi:TPA: fibronectin type III domain-containing protein [Bacillus cereus]